jgi:hypothetical protein
MKLIYKSEKYRKHNLIKSERMLRKLSRKGVNVEKKSSYLQINKYFNSEILTAPEVFSVQDNFLETMLYLKKVDSFAWHGRKGLVDLSKINKITPDAVLYLLSCIDRQQDLHTSNNIKGNAPENEYCKKVFLKSGFFRFVNSNYKHQEDIDILSIRTGKLVSAKEAGAVVEYVRRKFKLERNQMTRATYVTIMETMNNVHEHAYYERGNDRWWLMALHDNTCDRIHFTILDNGRGIPATIRRKIPDYFTGNDGELIKATFSEKNRSETRLPYRGKGLPKIKALFDRELIKNLVVISRNGYFNSEDDIAKNMNIEYKGTIISWDFIRKEQCND